MNRICSFVYCLLLSVTSAFSQAVIGDVMDENHLPVGYVNVVLLSLPDSTFLQGVITDDKGHFVFEKTDDRQKVLQISYVGYQRIDMPCTAGNVGTVVLSPSAILLGETVITGHRPTYTLKGNSLTTNVQNSLLSNVGTGNDVLKRIPGVRVGQSKEIEVFGKGAPLIYINGRQVRDPSELEQLNSSEISKVELITNPGAEYDAEVKAVLKIKTVKPVGEGLGGYVRLKGDYASAWERREQVNLNYRKGGLDIFTSVMNDKRTGIQNEKIEQVLRGEQLWSLTDEADIESDIHVLTAQMGTNYQFNENHTAGVAYDFQRMPYKGAADMLQRYQVYRDEVHYDDLNSTIHMDKKGTTHKVNTYYNGTFFDKLTLNANFDLLYGKNSTSQYTDEQSSLQESRIVSSLGEADYHLYAGKLMFTYPIGKGSLKWGGEWVKTDRNDSYQNKENIIEGSDSHTEEEKGALFVSYDIALGTTFLGVGARYEHTRFDYFVNNERQEEQSRAYDNLFPTLSFSFPLKDFRNSFSYTVKTMRPRYEQLDGSVQYSNRYMYKKGNPLLQPQTMHDLTWMTSYKFLNISLSYQYIKDYMDTERMLYSEESSISLSTNRNFDKNQRLNFLISASPKISFWQPSASIYVTQQFFKTTSMGQLLSYNNPMAYFTLNNDFVLPKEFIFSLNMDYHTEGSEGSRQQLSSGSVDIGLRKDFLKKRLTVNIIGTDLFHTFRQGATQYSPQCINFYEDTYNSRRVEMSVTYRFNSTRSKYRGEGAANEEIRRL